MADATMYDLFGTLTSAQLGAGDVEMPGVAQASAELSLVTNVDDFLRIVDALKANLTVDMTPAQAATFTGALDSVAESVRLGEIAPSQAAWAFDWVSYYLGVPVLTPGDLEAGRLRVWLQTFAVNHGWRPPADGTAAVAYPSGVHPGSGMPVAYPAPGDYSPPAGVPSAGRQAVIAGLVTVGDERIPAPGFTAAQDAAITRAFGVATANMAKVTAEAVDAMLPGMAPGQVPAELRQYSAAIDRLINQVRSVWATLGHPHVGGIEEEIRRLQVSAHDLTVAADRIDAQLAGLDRSALLDLIQADGRRLDSQGRWLHTVAELLPTLAPLTVVHQLEAEWRHVEAQLSERSPSFLFDTVRGLETETKAVRARVEQLAKTMTACCDEFQTAQREVGGKQAWPHLGSLAKHVFTLLFMAGMVETAVAALDAPVAVDAIVADTATIAGWVDGTSGVVPAVLAWGDRIAGVAS